MIVWELAAVFVMGALGGALVNLVVPRLRLSPRALSPWQRYPPNGPRARWDDRLPLVGWLRWRRHEASLGRRFWWRPLAVEVACAAGLAALYYFEVHADGLTPAGAFLSPGAARAIFASHAILVLLLVAASLIDLDEKIIPDAITLPGTLAGFFLAAILPASRLPIGDWDAQEPVHALPLLLASPNAWPAWLDGGAGLAVGLAAFGAWCAALLPMELPLRRGWGLAWALFARRFSRDPLVPWIGLTALLGSIAIAVVWHRGGEPWPSLLSALAGAALAGGLTWSMRIMGSWALAREALGFGDVTLMAMIGAYLGWQPAVIVFFTAPFLGIVIGVAQWVVHRNPEIPYGPYLCAAALMTILAWVAIWDRTAPIFALGPWLFAVLATCLALMYPLLGVVRLILGDPSDDHHAS